MTALLLTPGASATRDQPALVAIDVAAAGLGVEVERIDLPRRAERAVDVVAAAAAELRQRHATVVLGGRSYGGRVCSMAVAGGCDASGLVLVSYPLHPPGRPAQLRVDHFPAIDVPCLFVSGTRDAFATPEELEEHAKAIAGPVTHVWCEGADHGMRGRDQEVAGAVSAWLATLRLPDVSS